MHAVGTDPQAFGSNCWDWTGSIIGDERYDTREGLQINVVNRMAEDLNRQLTGMLWSAANGGGGISGSGGSTADKLVVARNSDTTFGSVLGWATDGGTLALGMASGLGVLCVAAGLGRTGWGCVRRREHAKLDAGQEKEEAAKLME